MRISAEINRLWGDIAGQPWAVGILAAVVVGVAFLAAVGVVVAGRRVERWLAARTDRRRRARAVRLAVREPGVALAADDDRGIWRDAPPAPLPVRRRPQPTAEDINDLITGAIRLCRADARRDA